MTSEQIKNLVALVAANFPATQNRDMAPTAELWYRTLGDLPYPLLEATLARVLMTAKYFPTVAEIRETAVELANRDTLSPAEAWNSVAEAISRFGYYNVQRAMESLQPLTRRVVECFGWNELCHAENPEIIRSQFLRLYEQLARKETALASLPASLTYPPGNPLPGQNGEMGGSQKIHGNKGALFCER